jgi:hypothetical protein
MEEKMQILKMIEDGVVSSEEGLKLLSALEEDEKTENLDGSKVKFLKVKVVDPTGKTKVNIKIPISLVNVGIKIGKKFSPELQESMGGIEFDDIIKMIQDGAEGRLVDVESEEGEIVQIYVE